MPSHKTKQSLFQCLSRRKTFWEWVKLNLCKVNFVICCRRSEGKREGEKQTNLQAISGQWQNWSGEKETNNFLMRSLCSQSLRWSPESDISLEEDCWRFKQSRFMTDSINSSIWDFTAKWKSFYYQTLQKQYKMRPALPKLTETILEFTEGLQGCCQVVAKVVYFLLEALLQCSLWDFVNLFYHPPGKNQSDYCERNTTAALNQPQDFSVHSTNKIVEISWNKFNV